MTLATQADVEAALGRDLSEAEAARVESLLTRASGLVIGYTRQDFEPAPYPDVVVAVVGDMVARALTAATSGTGDIEQQSAGPFSIRFAAGSTSSSPWLSAADKLILRPWRRGGGLSSVLAVGERYVITDEV